MCPSMPDELWIQILKEIEPNKLIQCRQINSSLKKIIDNNISCFYRNYVSKYSHLNLTMNSNITSREFERLNTLLSIDKLSQHGCSPYFIKKMQIERFTMHEVNVVRRLYLIHGIEFYAGIHCSKMSAEKIAIMLELKNAGFPIFFANRFTNEFPITREKIEMLKYLKSLGISDHFCGKMTYSFNENQRNQVFDLMKSNPHMKWYNAIYLVESGIENPALM
jgi:hypothetical protein